MMRSRGKHCIFFGLFLLLLSAGLPDAGAGPLRPAPGIVCEESEYYFGAVPNTEVISHDFILANEGTRALHLRAVRADCGCVLTKIEDDLLDPGESTVLRVQFNLKGRGGKQLRRIIVESNDPEQPRLILALIGDVLVPMEIVPDQIYWGNIHIASTAEKSCEIRFHENDESYVTSVVSPLPNFSAELITVKPRRIYKVVVRPVPPLHPGGFRSALRVTTDHPRFRTIEIPMQGRIVSDFFSIPDEIAIKSSDSRPVSRILIICSGLKKKFKLLEVKVPRPEIEARFRPLAAGSGYRIELRNIVPADELDGECVIIVTDCEAMPILAVPFSVTDNDEP